MTDTALGTEQPNQTEDPATTSAPVEGQAVDTQQQPETAAPEEQKDSQQTALAGKPEGAPEAYEFTVPEGQELHDSVREAFEGRARELNLTNEGAQSILDAVLPKMKDAADTRLMQMREEWRESARNDEEIGGAAFDTNLRTAIKALDRFGSDEARTLLNESGLGDHPAFIRMFNRIGKAISEDSILTGGTATRLNENLDDPAVQAARMYPSK